MAGTIAEARQLPVYDTQQLEQAFRTVSAGDEIVLFPGEYKVYRLDTRSGGTPDQPIRMRAMAPGLAIIRARGVEAISVHHPYWIFENLAITGTPNTEHAFHIVGGAKHVIVRNTVITDFHAHIKVNGENGIFPDFGLLENNDFLNTSIRQTSVPVTDIDIVGGEGWIVRGNYISEFEKGLGNQTSYGAFLKGNSSNGIMERNLVICSKHPANGIMIGLSFGGGGTSVQACANQDCTYEHSHGIIRNNIIINCSDVGIYLNKSYDILIEHNTLLLTSGIDVRFRESSVSVNHNIISGSIRSREGGEIIESDSNMTLGTVLGMYLPSVARKLKHRISNYDSKFPNWITVGNVQSWQEGIDSLVAYLQDTRLGLGREAIGELFPGLSIGDLSPDIEALDRLASPSDAFSMDTDFWGRRRSATKNVLGAIDFFVSPCDIFHRIKHHDTGAIKPCLPSD